jgi:rare lipoprotein A
VLALCGCGTTPTHDSGETVSRPTAPTAPPATQSKGGGYYLDDGPGEAPANVDSIPDAQPRDEPLHRYANKPYVALGRQYVPEPERAEFRQRGLASWYGRRFHGKPTASGEPYDMYGMTAAHPTMPIPSYARVTNVANGRSVVVRINDRGPFLHGRVIDLSYAAAHKLGYIGKGSTLVEVERVYADSEDASTTVAAASASPAAKSAQESKSEATNTGIYVQVGAFSARSNAESLRAQITREITESLDRAIEVVSHQGLFRVRLGPFASHGEASSLAEQLRRQLNIKPYIVR